LPQSLK